ncbi:MAG: DUF3108 domain-containing protein [Ignavibacteria bacterium]|nr:DUF3108 domain-containing protein [Ignavibacteria bacterium]
MKYYWTIVFVVILLPATVLYSQSKILQVGEELVYTVSFGFIKLGEVKFNLNSSYYENNRKYFTAKAEMKSFEGVPFLNVRYIFESIIREEKGRVLSEKFHSSEFKDENSGQRVILRTDYEFDYFSDNDTGYIKVKRYRDNGRDKILEVDKTETFEKGIEFQDGLSVIYLARINSFKKERSKKVNIYINEKQSYVAYSFNYNRDAVSIDLFDYDMAAIKIDGKADFVGVLGLTGEFEGWLSDDEARVPLKARFNIILGSVTLELTSYKKTGWKPPKFNE